MQSKSRMLEAFRLVWIVCLTVEAMPAKQTFGLDNVQESDDGNPNQNFPELMMAFFKCDLDQTCLEEYGWPAEYPHTEYTVRAVIGNGEGYIYITSYIILTSRVCKNNTHLLDSLFLSCTYSLPEWKQFVSFFSTFHNGSWTERDAVKILQERDSKR